MKCDIDSSKTWIILIRNLISIDSNILVLSGDIYKAFLICRYNRYTYSDFIYGLQEVDKIKIRGDPMPEISYPQVKYLFNN